MKKKLQFACLASLIVNVLLIGVLLGQLPNRFEQGLSRQQSMEQALQELPEPMQAQVRDKIDQMHEAVEPIREQIREARDEAVRTLITEPFDQAAYERQVDTINDLRLQRSKRMAATFKELAKALPPAQRNVLAKILRRPPSSR
jgi:uncharacterized membrane protein